MKIALVYAPDRCLPTTPYSSLAHLAAVLRQGGHQVTLHDLNAEVFDWLNRTERLAQYYDFAAHIVDELERRPHLDAAAAARYRTLAPLMAAPRDWILRAPESAAVMRSRDAFYDPVRFNRAFDDLMTMVRVMYAANPVFDPENRFFVERNLEALDVVDPVAHAYAQGCLDSLLAEKPTLIGFALPFAFQFFETLRAARVLKERLPEARIVVGGPTINDYADRLFATPALFDHFDYAVAGEGERAIVALAQALGNGGAFAEVPNLYWREGGKTQRSTLPPDVPNLNEFPGPDFRGFPFDRYLTPERLVSLQTSRGCYYGKCTFCGDGFRRNFRLRAPDLVYEDLKRIQADCDVNHFFFWDSLAPPKTLKHVAEKIAANGDDIHWFAETKFEKPYLNPRLIETLRRGGCHFLQFGLESASERVLDLMDKGNDMERVDRILALLKENGIWAGVSWFIGFPTETEDEALQTYAFIADRADRVGLCGYIGTFLLGRDTIAFANPDRFGIRRIETAEGAVDYVMADGTPHFDWTELDLAFRARSDLWLINSGWYFLYASHRPSLVPEISSLRRFGRQLGRQLESFDFMKLLPSDVVRLREYRIDPFAPGSDRPITAAYHGKTHRHIPLEEIEVAIFDRADGRSVGEIKADLRPLFDLDPDPHIRRLIDRGILLLPEAPPHSEAHAVAV